MGISSNSSYPIYLDHHSTTPIDSQSLAVLTDCLGKSFGNPHSATVHGRLAHSKLEQGRAQVAEFIGALPREIQFVSGATQANNMAIQGIEALKSSGRNKIITSKTEHPCVLETVRYMSNHRGFQLVELSTDTDGLININDLEEALDDSVALVSIMLVNNEIGVIQPIKEIAMISHKYGALVHTDAAQAGARIPIDVDEMDVDLLSLSSHKMYGPPGIGCLFVRQDVPIGPTVFGGGQQSLISGTVPSALCASFGHACENASIRMEADRVEIRELQNQFLTDLMNAVPGVLLNGPHDQAKRVTGNLNISISGIDAKELAELLSPDISLSAGSACASSKKSTSHVLEALGYSSERVRSSIRIGIGRSNTSDQIKFATNKIAVTVERLRNSPSSDGQTTKQLV